MRKISDVIKALTHKKPNIIKILKGSIEPMMFVGIAAFLFLCGSALFYISHQASLYSATVVTQWLTFGLAFASIGIGGVCLFMVPVVWWTEIKQRVSELRGYKFPR